MYYQIRINFFINWHIIPEFFEGENIIEYIINNYHWRISEKKWYYKAKITDSEIEILNDHIKSTEIILRKEKKELKMLIKHSLPNYLEEMIPYYL